MKYWKTLLKPSVYWKILSGFGLIILLMVLAAVFSYTRLIVIRTQTDQAVPTIGFTASLRVYGGAVVQLDSDLQRYFVVGGTEVQDAISKDLIDMQRALDTAPNNLLPQYLPGLQQLQEVTMKLRSMLPELLAMDATKIDAMTMNIAIRDVTLLIDTAKESEQKLSTAILDDLDQFIATQTDSVGITVNSLIGITGIALVIGLIVSLVVSRSIVNPLMDMAAAAGQLASGKLDVRVSIHSKDEPGQMAISFNAMADQIQTLLENLQTTNNSLQISNQGLRIATAEAKEASRLKSELLSTMSHELRTPLNAMIGFAELMLAGASGSLTEKQKHQVSRIHANSLRLLRLIDDVLDLARIEAGRVEIHYATFAPRDMVTKVVSQVSPLAEKKGLRFFTTIDEKLPPTLLGDQARTEQIVLNLLSNAFKFTEKGEVELILRSMPDMQQWTLSVRDTGIGIPPHAQEYIFEEFRQVDGTSRRAYGGSGLGLAICRNLSRLMDGDIKVQSTLGQGSTFTVTLPLKLSIVDQSAQSTFVATPAIAPSLSLA